MKIGMKDVWDYVLSGIALLVRCVRLLNTSSLIVVAVYAMKEIVNWRMDKQKGTEEYTFSIFRRSSSISAISSVSSSGLAFSSRPRWWGTTMGKSLGKAKMFRSDHASKKSKAISEWDSRSVENATRPCSTASRESRSISSSISSVVARAFPFWCCCLS